MRPEAMGTRKQTVGIQTQRGILEWQSQQPALRPFGCTLQVPAFNKRLRVGCADIMITSQTLQTPKLISMHLRCHKCHAAAALAGLASTLSEASKRNPLSSAACDSSSLTAKMKANSRWYMRTCGETVLQSDGYLGRRLRSKQMCKSGHHQDQLPRPSARHGLCTATKRLFF